MVIVNVVYWPPTRSNMHSKDGGSAYSMGVGELGWQLGTGLKSHCTVTNWLTGRGWPVNCMSYFRSMTIKACHSKGVGVELLYYWVHRKFNQFGEKMRLRKTAPGRRDPRYPRLSFVDQTSWWQDAVEKASIQQRAGPPGLRLSSPGDWEINADGHKSGGQYVAVLFGLPTPSHTQPFQIKWEVYFSKRLSSLVVIMVCRYDFHMHAYGYAHKVERNIWKVEKKNHARTLLRGEPMIKSMSCLWKNTVIYIYYIYIYIIYIYIYITVISKRFTKTPRSNSNVWW